MTASNCVDDEKVAEVLGALSLLMTEFGHNDLALQDALSALTARAHSSSEMTGLQHIDLITQTHKDLANLLRALAGALKGQKTELDDLKDTLTLRSLQDTLLENAENTAPTPGELSLF